MLPGRALVNEIEQLVFDLHQQEVPDALERYIVEILSDRLDPDYGLYEEFQRIKKEYPHPQERLKAILEAISSEVFEEMSQLEERAALLADVVKEIGFFMGYAEEELLDDE